MFMAYKISITTSVITYVGQFYWLLQKTMPSEFGGIPTGWRERMVSMDVLVVICLRTRISLCVESTSTSSDNIATHGRMCIEEFLGIE